MPIIDDRSGLREHIRFHCNAAVEMVASLHVLAEPYHHDNTLEWALRARQKLSPMLKKEIDFFSLHYNQWSFILDIVSMSVEDDNNRIEPILSKISEMPETQFIETFLGHTDVDSENIDEWIKKQGDSEETFNFISKEDAIYFLSDPIRMRARLISVLNNYWHEFFAVEWEKIRNVISKYIEEQRLVLSKLDPANYVSALFKNRLDDEAATIFNKKGSKLTRFEQFKEIRVFPSVFTAPHQMMNVINDALYIYLNLDYYLANDYYSASKDEAPKILIDSLSALSDGTRLKIVKLLYNREHTTKELSEKLGFSAATISQHLRVLREARIVKTKKVKNYVYYSLIQGSVEDTYRMINIYLKS